jgi:hypothetical protein
VVERVEIVEDTETEPESIDTDPDERDIANKHNMPSNKESIISLTLRKEPVSILKCGNSSYSKIGQNDLSDFLDESLDRSINSFIQKDTVSNIISTAEEIKPHIDTESMAVYLIHDKDEHALTKNKNLFLESWDREVSRCISSGARRKVINSREVTFARIQENQTINPPLSKKTKMQQLISSIEIKEDCDSFYGSDKETDDVLIFSDDTELDIDSSSSEESETHFSNFNNSEDLLDKV